MFFYYLQLKELKSKRSNKKHQSDPGTKDGEGKAVSTSGSLNLKGGNNLLEEPGLLRRHHGKGNNVNKPHASQRQRLFSNGFRSQGRNRHGFVSESPPTNSIGFFFGSTPPESQGSVVVETMSYV